MDPRITLGFIEPLDGGNRQNLQQWRLQSSRQMERSRDGLADAAAHASPSQTFEPQRPPSSEPHARRETDNAHAAVIQHGNLQPGG